MSIREQVLKWWEKKDPAELKHLVVFMSFRMFWPYAEQFERVQAVIPELTQAEWDQYLYELDEHLSSQL